MKKSILSILFILIASCIWAQTNHLATANINEGARYNLNVSYYDYHVNVDTTGGVVDTTKIYLPAKKLLGQEYLITTSTQDSTKPVVIYANGSDLIDHSASTFTLTFKTVGKATSVALRWVGGQSGWKILFKY